MGIGSEPIALAIVLSPILGTMILNLGMVKVLQILA